MDTHRTPLLVGLAVACLCAACGPGADAAGVTRAGPWDTRTVLEVAAPLAACDVGDVDRKRAGPEIVVGVDDGRVLALHRRASVWHAEEIHRVPEEIVDLVVEDVAADAAGPEIVVLTRAIDEESEAEIGRVQVLRRVDRTWTSETIGKVPAPPLKLLIGEVHPDGSEADIVAFGPGLAIWTHGEEGWAGDAPPTWAPDAERDRLHDAAIGPAGVVFKATADPVVYAADFERIAYHAWPTGSFARFITEQNRRTFGPDWTPPLKYAVRCELVCFGNAGAAQTCVAVGDPGLLFGCQDGTLRILDPDGTARIVHRGPYAPRRLLLADVDPIEAGQEAVLADDGGAITILRTVARDGERGAWQPLVLIRDAGGIRDLVCAELTPTGRGREIVAVGDAGRVILSARVR